MLVQTFAEVVKTVCHDKHANICRAIYGSKYAFLCTFFLFPLSHFPFGNTLDEKEMKCHTLTPTLWDPDATPTLVYLPLLLPSFFLLLSILVGVHHELHLSLLAIHGEHLVLSCFVFCPAVFLAFLCPP